MCVCVDTPPTLTNTGVSIGKIGEAALLCIAGIKDLSLFYTHVNKVACTNQQYVKNYMVLWHRAQTVCSLTEAVVLVGVPCSTVA